MKINKQLLEEDYRELVLFFMSKKDSSKNQIILDEYDYKTNTLALTFAKGSNKFKILDRKNFVFKHYEIEAFESKTIQNNLKEKYDNILITENIELDYSQSGLDFYMKLLIGKTATMMLKKVKSIIDENLLIFQFEQDIVFNQVKENLKYYPTLNYKVIKIYEAFETMSVLVKFNSFKFFNEEYLNEKFKLKGFMYWQVPFSMNNSPFVIVKFLDMDFKFDFLLNYSKISEKDYFIENIFNDELINDYLKKFEINCEKQNKSEPVQKNLN